MAWIVLVLAGLFEIGWAVGLKYTEGFTRLWPTLGTVASMIVSLGLLGLALRSLPLGTAYAVWTGIGTVGTILSMIVSLGLLGLALRSLPLGTAYAIWTGVGTVGTALLGMALFQESAEVLRLLCIGLIVAGIVGLKLVTP